MTVGGGFGFPAATANYTVAAWLYVASTDAEPPVAAVLSNEIPWGVGPPGGWSLSLDAPGPGASPKGRYRFTYWFGQQPDSFIEVTCDCVAFDAWTHLAAVIDATAGTLTFFVGGQARQQTPITRGIWPAPGALYIGRWPSPGRLLNGMLDDAAIYSRALVPEEIRLLAYAPATDPDVAQAPRARRSRCMRMCAASTAVLASPIARSNAARASSLRPSCASSAPRTPKKWK